MLKPTLLAFLACLWAVQARCPKQCHCDSYTINCSSKQLDYIPFFLNIEIRPETIDLSDNKFEEVSKYDFQFDQSSIVNTVNLSRTNLRKIDEKAFFTLVNLQKLDLSRNNLSEIPENFVENNTQLHELDLSGNLFELFPKMKSASLEALHLRHSKIAVIPEDSLTDLPRLFVLDLSYNNLKRLNLDIFQSLPVFFVVLNHNPWNCNCESVQLFDYLSTKQFIKVDQPIQCEIDNKTIAIYDENGATSELQCNEEISDFNQVLNGNDISDSFLYNLNQFLPPSIIDQFQKEKLNFNEIFDHFFNEKSDSNDLINTFMDWVTNGSNQFDLKAISDQFKESDIVNTLLDLLANETSQLKPFFGQLSNKNIDLNAILELLLNGTDPNFFMADLDLDSVLNQILKHPFFDLDKIESLTDLTKSPISDQDSLPNNVEIAPIINQLFNAKYDWNAILEQLLNGTDPSFFMTDIDLDSVLNQILKHPIFDSNKVESLDDLTRTPTSDQDLLINDVEIIPIFDQLSTATPNPKIEILDETEKDLLSVMTSMWEKLNEKTEDFSAIVKVINETSIQRNSKLNSHDYSLILFTVFLLSLILGILVGAYVTYRSMTSQRANNEMCKKKIIQSIA